MYIFQIHSHSTKNPFNSKDLQFIVLAYGKMNLNIINQWNNLDIGSIESHYLALFIHCQELGLFLVKKRAQPHVFLHKFLDFGLFLRLLTL